MTGFRILLVEDDDDHAELALFHLTALAPEAEVVRAKDGEQALVALTERRPIDGPVFDLVLLDLNLPRCNGLEVIRKARTLPQCFAVPFLILSTSNSEHDKVEAYRGGINGYMVKPTVFDQYRVLISDVLAYWKRQNRLPGKSS